MGILLFDQYTYLHFAVGIIAYFWNVSLLKFLIIHTIFEIVENTDIGMWFINNVTIWPGGKAYPDQIINRIGDTIGAVFGWYSAYCVDYTGSKNKWFPKHIL
jgi:hypothetical protein